MHLISVNLGWEQTIEAPTPIKTGIFKHPIQGAVQITALGLAGDAVCNTQHHGGPDQAVYIYGGADYDWWSQELGYPLEPGTFGENLTISSLESAAFQAGDRLTIGEVRLEVTAPRIPCGKLAARMGDNHFTQRFREAERPGLYCRVLREGLVQAGDEVRVERFGGATVSILEMFRTHYEPALLDEAALRRHLAAPIAIRERVVKEDRLHRFLEAG